MKLTKCPRCELNYVREGEEYCDVCLKDLKKVQPAAEIEETICPECGENPVMKGQELCMACFIEKKKLEKVEALTDTSATDDDNIIAIEDILDSDIPDEEIEIVEDDLEMDVDLLEEA